MPELQSAAMPDTNASPRALRVAITGGGGFIGRRLAEMLAQDPGVAEVRALVRRPSGQPNAVVVRLDRAEELRRAVEGCDAVVHCAFDFYDMPANVGLAHALADACLPIGARLVQISTAAVYEPLPPGDLNEDGVAEPAGPGDAGFDYKNTKIAIERALLQRARNDGLDLVILQPTIVYGPAGGAWTDSPVRELLTRQVALPDEGRGLCNAVFVDDVCQAAMAALTAKAAAGERFLISGPGPVAWKEFLGAYEAMLGVRSLRLLSRAELPLPDRTTASASSGGGTSLLRSIKRVVAGRLGASARSRLSLVLNRVRTLVRGEAVLMPAGLKLALYAASCTVRIDKARRLLDYDPHYDLARGMAATQPYVQRTYAKAGATDGATDGPGKPTIRAAAP